jgi:hypothetical protein
MPGASAKAQAKQLIFSPMLCSRLPGKRCENHRGGKMQRVEVCDFKLAAHSVIF